MMTRSTHGVSFEMMPVGARGYLLTYDLTIMGPFLGFSCKGRGIARRWRLSLWTGKLSSLPTFFVAVGVTSSYLGGAKSRLRTGRWEGIGVTLRCRYAVTANGFFFYDRTIFKHLFQQVLPSRMISYPFSRRFVS